MPNHRHTITTGAAGSGSGSNGLNGTGYTRFTNYEGGGQAHNNLQPYNTVNYIVKT